MGKGSWGTVVKVAGVEDFDEIEFQAARTGNHVRAAVRMSELTRKVEPGLRAESHLRAGEQWMMADDPQRAADEFTAAIEDGGPTFADPRVHLARALLGLGRDAEAQQLLSRLTAEREAVTPRTCDLLAELMTEQGDLRTALDWATTRSFSCCSAFATGYAWISASMRTITTGCWTAPGARPDTGSRLVTRPSPSP
jgi:predicted Zn-dependent protease